MRATDTDYTDKFGPSIARHDIEWPMYSFSAPAVDFWNGLANGLRERGWPEDKIKWWLQSKHARWMMDGPVSDNLSELGRSYAKIATDEEI